MPFTIHNSRFKLPSAVANPLAVMWNNTLIVLAMENKRLRRIVFIKVSGSEEWSQRKTGGEVPGDRFYTEHTAQVIEDKIYLFVRQFYGFRAIYCLDLNSWTWALSNTDAPDISGGGGLLPSWVFKEKMYHYSDHRLFCYDVSKNFWEVGDRKDGWYPGRSWLLSLASQINSEHTHHVKRERRGLMGLKHLARDKTRRTPSWEQEEPHRQESEESNLGGRPTRT